MPPTSTPRIGARAEHSVPDSLGAILFARGGRSPERRDRAGVDYLVRTQREDGTWDEPYFTGTGFPGYGVGQRRKRYLRPDEAGYQGNELPAGFMINYHMYRNYWPLMSLGRYRRSLSERSANSESGPDPTQTKQSMSTPA